MKQRNYWWLRHYDSGVNNIQHIKADSLIDVFYYCQENGDYHPQLVDRKKDVWKGRKFCNPIVLESNYIEIAVKRLEEHWAELDRIKLEIEKAILNGEPPWCGPVNGKL